ncbi:rhodanese-like domain-containing protein [bacterium SCSIO 12741]|nr:rhodanese-like domain-containing protein [bacterium SCSIO 12741]
MKTLKLMVAVLLMGTSMITTACNGGSADQNQEQSAATVKDISVDEFNTMKSEKPGIILDVRTPGEVASGTVPGAIVIDIMDPDFEKKVNELDKNATVYVYCKAGGRSANASDKMNDWGFKTVYNVTGGFDAWSSKGYEVSK